VKPLTLSLNNGMGSSILGMSLFPFKFDLPTHLCKRVLPNASHAYRSELKSVTARRRSWRAKEYNSLTQGRPLSPSTQHYYEEQFGQGPMDYPAAQLYANGGNWQQETFNGYAMEAGLEPHPGHL
jgi:hypothetical protein